MELTVENLDALMMACLWNDELADSDTGASKVVEGIAHTYRFHMPSVRRRRKQIKELLNQLPIQFHAAASGGGGGWTFLNACQDAQGRKWTGLHLKMESLVMLGIAAGLVQWCLPRDMWGALPGEMPYFVVDLETA